MLENLKTDVNSLRPANSKSDGARRRTVLQSALGVAYAAAAAPLMAQTAIHTSAEGLIVGEQIYDVDGHTVPFYYAAPAGKSKLPVVLVVHEIFGVHAYIADVCRRFAQAGYLAIAPDLFSRQGDPSKYSDIPTLIAEVASKVPDAQVMNDLDGALTWAADNGGNLRKLAVTGFCMGGASRGCMRRTTKKSKRRWRGTDAWWARPQSACRPTRWTWLPLCMRPYWLCTAARTPASLWTP